MSLYSNRLNLFLLNSLEPEINRLNLQASSLEEIGFENEYLLGVRNKLEKLIPIYDFLKEYADGGEECDWSDLIELIRITGLDILDINSEQPTIPSSVNSDSTSIPAEESQYFVLLINGKVYDGSILNSNKSYNFSFVPATDVDSITVLFGESTFTKNTTVKIINPVLTSGTNTFSVTGIKDGLITFNKKITIQVE
jgi:hypothetical protein